MAANQFERHGKARGLLKEIFASPEKVSVIHYSCESFYDLPDGRSPRITSIAIRNLSSGQTVSFSIHQTAELKKLPLQNESLSEHYDELEKEMLDNFAVHLQNHMPSKFLHWNMRDQNYGFQAIEHRHKVIGGTPITVPDDRKVDLSRLFVDMYGVGYIGHPRLEKILQLNNITSQDFMTGKQEAEAFEQGRYVDLHRSTLRKVDVLANLAQRAWDKNLKTNSSWREMHGLSLDSLFYLIKKHPIYSGIILLAGILGAAVKLIDAYKHWWP